MSKFSQNFLDEFVDTAKGKDQWLKIMPHAATNVGVLFFCVFRLISRCE